MLFFPHVKKESLHRDKAALCIKICLPVPEQHALRGGTKNKIGKSMV